MAAWKLGVDNFDLNLDSILAKKTRTPKRSLNLILLSITKLVDRGDTLLFESSIFHPWEGGVGGNVLQFFWQLSEMQIKYM